MRTLAYDGARGERRAMRAPRSMHWWWGLVLLVLFVAGLITYKLLTRPHSAVRPPPPATPSGADPGQDVAPGATGIES